MGVLVATSTGSTVGLPPSTEGDDGADDGTSVGIMGMFDGGSVGDSNGNDGILLGCNVDSAVGITDLLVGKIVISVGPGVKGLVGVGLLVDVIVGILLLRLLVGPNVMVGISEYGT